MRLVLGDNQTMGIASLELEKRELRRCPKRAAGFFHGARWRLYRHFALVTRYSAITSVSAKPFCQVDHIDRVPGFGLAEKQNGGVRELFLDPVRDVIIGKCRSPFWNEAGWSCVVNNKRGRRWLFSASYWCPLQLGCDLNATPAGGGTLRRETWKF